MLEKNMADIIG